MGELDLRDVPITVVHGVDRTPAAIREVLDPEQRARFEEEYRAALAEAAESFDLTAVTQMIEHTWWVRAIWCRNPEMLVGVEEDIRRVRAGDPTVFAKDDE